MPREAGKLTVVAVNAAGVGKHFDGGGLYLDVRAIAPSDLTAGLYCVERLLDFWIARGEVQSGQTAQANGTDGESAMGRLITPRLMQTLRRQFRLDWQGIHGAPHWARVRYHGVWLARALNADERIPALFAVLHDSQRENDRYDPGHGERAADYAGWLCAKGYFELEPAALRLLQQACSGHSDGHKQADCAVQVCWDGDRLDLGRVGKRPDPQYLCTEPAREPQRIAQAWAWSRR